MPTYWSDEDRRYIEYDSLHFTGRGAFSLCGEGWVQKNGDPVSARAAHRDSFITQKEAGATYGTYNQYRRCACGSRMSHTSQRCRLCDLDRRRNGQGGRGPAMDVRTKAHCRGCRVRKTIDQLSAKHRLCGVCLGRKKAA